MTGFLTGSSQPLSALTVRSLFDIGYNIDASKADPFTITSTNQSPGRRLRSLQSEQQWETVWNGTIVWDLFPMNKSLELGENDWEIPYQGAVVTDLVVEEDAAPANVGAIAGGIIAALAVVGAAAFVVIKKQQNDKRTVSMTSANPMFNRAQPDTHQQQGQASFNPDQQFNAYAQPQQPSNYYAYNAQQQQQMVGYNNQPNGY